MAINTLSPEAEFISQLISHTECITINQVIQIMTDIKDLKEDITLKLIKILQNKQIIKIHKEKYLTPYFGPLKLDMIPSIWYAADCIRKLKDDNLDKAQNSECLLNAWSTLFSTENPDNLCFFIDDKKSKPKCLTTCNLSTTTTTIIDMKEMKYTKDKSLKRARKSIEDAIDNITVFIIFNDNDLDSWAEIFNEKTISFPYYICFITEQSNNQLPLIEVYKK